MNENQRSLINYRIDRSREVLKDAHTLADAGGWNSCVNRLYYSCFYAITALLLSKGLASSKYTGVRSLFNKHIVKSEVVPKSLGNLYNGLFESRHQSDYVDLRSFQAEEVIPMIKQTDEFVQFIIDLISNSK